MMSCTGDSQEVQLILVRGYMHVQQYARALEILGPNADKSGILDKDKRCAVAMVLRGHVLYLKLRWHKLRSDVREPPSHNEVLLWYEKALTQKSPFAELLSHVRMAKLYLWIGKYYEAKEVLIKACRLTPSATTWLGLAIACYRQKELDQAEQALCEANILDPHNSQVWGMLCVVGLAQNKHDEADMAMKQALKFGLNTQVSLSLSLCLSLVPSLSLDLFLSLSHARARALSLSLSLSRAHARSLSRARTRARALSFARSLARPPSLSLSRFFSSPLSLSFRMLAHPPSLLACLPPSYPPSLPAALPPSLPLSLSFH